MMTNELHWRHKWPEWSFSASSADEPQSLFFFFSSFSHPVDPQSSTTKEEKVKKIPLTVREYHTVEAAETDYQHKDYAVSVS